MSTPAYKILLYIDGSNWCALLGENIMEGYFGSGTSPSDAVEDLAQSIREANDSLGEPTEFV
jgi:hypothetical protein